MDGNNKPSHSSSTLPWHWVIEALAGLKQIPISTLQGLIDFAPVKPDDFSENTKELVAMRCLEELSAPSSSTSSALDSRVGLDFSRSCENVLQEILHEVPLSNLRTAGAELLKQDFKPFITHKRSYNAKCHLEQLKESILDGTLPLTDHLKEMSGLFQTNRAHTACVNDGTSDDHSVKDDGKSTYAEDIGAKENSASLILEDGNKSSKECLPDNNHLSPKRNRVYSADEHFMGCFNEEKVCTNECDDFLRTTKRIKCNASTNFDSEKKKRVSRSICMKCNEAGQLLVCKTTHCSLMVHKKCLGGSVQLDAQGTFLCPFCAYSQSVSEYFESKKIASLAMKGLVIFINKGIRKEAVELHESSRQKHILRKSYKCEHSSIPGAHSSSFRENENVNNELAVAVREKDESEMLNAKSLVGGRIEDTNHVGGHGNENVLQIMTVHNMDGRVEPVCANNTLKEEISIEECKKHNISSYSMRFLMHEVQYKKQASRKIRRKKVPWTVEEEKLMQEGVQKFGVIGSNIPWRKILAFGSHVFEKDGRHRTPQDLKDKWKRMHKAL